MPPQEISETDAKSLFLLKIRSIRRRKLLNSGVLVLFEQVPTTDTCCLWFEVVEGRIGCACWDLCGGRPVMGVPTAISMCHAGCQPPNLEEFDVRFDKRDASAMALINFGVFGRPLLLLPFKHVGCRLARHALKERKLLAIDALRWLRGCLLLPSPCLGWVAVDSSFDNLSVCYTVCLGKFLRLRRGICHRIIARKTNMRCRLPVSELEDGYCGTGLSVTDPPRSIR